MWQQFYAHRQSAQTHEVHLRHETAIQVQLLRIRDQTQVRVGRAHQKQTFGHVADV